MNKNSRDWLFYLAVGVCFIALIGIVCCYGAATSPGSEVKTMKKFVQIKDSEGRSAFVNLDAIIYIYQDKETLNATVMLKDTGYLESSETVEEVMEKIEEAMKNE